MPPFVHGALAAALLLSALGAVVVCLNVILYGFTGPDDEPPLTTARRLMYTRIGHALATTCFAGTAILIGMVLVRSSRPVPPAVVHDARLPELDARIAQQASWVAEIEARAGDASAGVARAETRLHDLAESLNRLAAEGSRTEHRVGRLEQSEARATAAERTATARKAPVPAPPVVLAPPVVVRAPEPTPAPAERLVPAPPPAPTPERVASASPRSAPERVVSSPPPPAPAPSSSVSTPDVPPASTPTATSSMPNGLRAKLRQDWIAIQKGFESSRDDIRRAFDGTVRKLREVGQ
jgi:outer membrane biosynthesis protein TonB